MYKTLWLWLWFNLSAMIAGEAQVPINGKNPKRYNVTLDFDDLPTNKSGIGFHPSPPSPVSFAYKGHFLNSFTVKDVAKAFPDLDSPIDITCASSAPSAIFGKRIQGIPYPHITLHDLSLPNDVPRANITFNMKSLMISPTGIVKGEVGKTIVQVLITLFKLPVSTADGRLDPSESWPGMVRGQPMFEGRFLELSGLWGPGSHESILVDFESIRKNYPGFAEGMDVMEFSGELFRLNDKKQVWESDGDWEFCVDDIKVEVVEGDTSPDIQDSELKRRPTVWFWKAQNGSLVLAHDLGTKLWKDLGRSYDDLYA